MLNKDEITPNPSSDEIKSAVRIINNQELHVYQLLYSERLTNPFGYPLKIRRKLFWERDITIMLEISVPNNHKGLSFTTDGSDDNEILNKSKMLLDAINREKIDSKACCPYAVSIECVCFKAFKCPIHGETHIGSHD
jgi:hypothetical protein